MTTMKNNTGFSAAWHFTFQWAFTELLLLLSSFSLSSNEKTCTFLWLLEEFLTKNYLLNFFEPELSNFPEFSRLSLIFELLQIFPWFSRSSLSVVNPAKLNNGILLRDFSRCNIWSSWKHKIILKKTVYKGITRFSLSVV